MGVMRIKEVRSKKGITQQDISDATGLSVAKVARYEKEENPPSPDALRLIANYLGVTVDYLIGNSDIPVSTLDPGDAKLIAMLKRLPSEKRLLLEDLTEEDLQYLHLIHGLPKEQREFLLKLEPEDVKTALYFKELPENPVPYVISDTLIGIPKDSDPKAINALRDYIEFIYDKYGKEE